MAVSSDGIVTVVSDLPWAAAKVTIVWGSIYNVWTTTVVRTNPDGSSVTLRSGDNTLSPGGSVFCYDFEAPLGVPCTYRAFGYTAAGALTRTSTAAVLASVGTVARQVGWVKSLAVPGLSVDLTVASVTTKRSRSQKVFAVPGRANPVVWEDVMSGRVGVLTVVALTAADRGGLRALLTAGGPAHIQFDPALGLADAFVVFADDQETPLGPRAAANSQFPLSYTEIDRPATAGVPLSIPGWTNDIVLTRYATWAAFDAAFATYLTQTAGP